jgi:glutathione S-transferase
VIDCGSSIVVLGRNTSSNVQKVMWLLAEIGAACTRVDMDGTYGGNREEEYLKKNPNGVVPTLLHGDHAVWESNTIVRYIANVFPDSGLYPAGAAARAQIERWMDWQLSTFGPANVLLYQGIIRTPASHRQPDAIEKYRARNAELVAILDGVLAQHKFVAGNEFTLADIAMGPQIHRWFNLPVERPEAKHVRNWYDGLCERASFVEHVRNIAFV